MIHNVGKKKILEGSHSGLVRSLGKRVCLNRHREFESRPFRNFSKRVSEPKIWSARSVCK